MTLECSHWLRILPRLFFALTHKCFLNSSARIDNAANGAQMLPTWHISVHTLLETPPYCESSETGWLHFFYTELCFFYHLFLFSPIFSLHPRHIGSDFHYKWQGVQDLPSSHSIHTTVNQATSNNAFWLLGSVRDFSKNITSINAISFLVTQGISIFPLRFWKAAYESRLVHLTELWRIRRTQPHHPKSGGPHDDASGLSAAKKPDQSTFPAWMCTHCFAMCFVRRRHSTLPVKWLPSDPDGRLFSTFFFIFLAPFFPASSPRV